MFRFLIEPSLIHIERDILLFAELRQRGQLKHLSEGLAVRITVGWHSKLVLGVGIYLTFTHIKRAHQNIASSDEGSSGLILHVEKAICFLASATHSHLVSTNHLRLYERFDVLL